MKKRIFVFEYTVGGGFYAEEITSSLLCEGYAMLRSIAEDFKNLDYEIITQIDRRISHLAKYLSVDQFYSVDSDNKFDATFSKCMDMVDICFIIAPEFSNILYHLTRVAFNLNKAIISIGLEGIKLGTSKIATYNFFKNYDIKTPITFLIPSLNGKIDLNFIYEQFDKYNFPFIIKPDDGVGAESIYFFPDIDAVVNFFSNPYLDFNFKRKYILQEFIYGEDYSVSIINKPFKNNLKNGKTILSINSQKIKYKNCLGKALYEGGYTPVPRFNFLKKKLMKLLNKIDLNNFNGYLGIDFILTKENEIYFIEINPRLTTSYIGIRKIYSQNILSLLVQNNDR
ncbi:MAG: ATP-grasp domain-containing protein, partial [Candidatus Hermodarchaeota archaeon]